MARVLKLTVKERCLGVADSNFSYSKSSYSNSSYSNSRAGDKARAKNRSRARARDRVRTKASNRATAWSFCLKQFSIDYDLVAQHEWYNEMYYSGVNDNVILVCVH